LYAPLVYRFARRCRLQDADAADVTQEVLKAVARSSGRLDYDPARGSFRAWLLTVVRSKLCNFVTRSKCRRKEAAETPVDLPAPEEEQALWDLEYERRILRLGSRAGSADFRRVELASFLGDSRRGQERQRDRVRGLGWAGRLASRLGGRACGPPGPPLAIFSVAQERRELKNVLNELDTPTAS
jgi:RNA polymerase sigma-70 factor (ECF subfamily)